MGFLFPFLSLTSKSADSPPSRAPWTGNCPVTGRYPGRDGRHNQSLAAFRRARLWRRVYSDLRKGDKVQGQVDNQSHEPASCHGTRMSRGGTRGCWQPGVLKWAPGPAGMNTSELIKICRSTTPVGTTCKRTQTYGSGINILISVKIEPEEQALVCLCWECRLRSTVGKQLLAWETSTFRVGRAAWSRGLCRWRAPRKAQPSASLGFQKPHMTSQPGSP